MGYGNYPDLTPVQKILVVKLRHLGDVLLASPVFSCLKQALPNAEIDAYVYEEAVPMLEGHPAIRRILGYDRRWKGLGFFSRMLREINLLRQIRSAGYDLILNLTEGDRGAMAARVSRAKIRVGVDPRKIYTHVAKSCSTPRHTVERQLDALRRIGIFPEPEERELCFTIPEKARRSAFQKIPWENYVLIHPAARWKYKCWPVDKMRRVCRALLDRGEKIVFTSGPDSTERAMVEEIAKGFNDGVCNLAGKISLKELGALIEQAKVLLCVDSVPLHLASAVKAPAVILFGPTSEITWGPWRNPRARVLAESLSCRPCFMDGCGGSKRSDCLAQLSVERVLAALQKYL